jgi:hypothetical protein
MEKVMVDVDDNAIKALSYAFDDISKNDIAPAQTGVNNVTINPGTFAEATTLTNVLQQRATSLKTYLTKLKTTTDGISTDLWKVAGNYKTTEEENKMTASDIQTVVDDANRNMPGLKDTDNNNIHQPAVPDGK